MVAGRHLVLSIAFRAVVCLVLIGAAVGIAGALVRTKPEPGRVDADLVMPRIPTATARPVEVARRWTGYGTARARFTSDVPARVASTVIEIPAAIAEGAAVEPGQVLARLDASDFEHEERIAERAIADLEAQVQRLEIERKSWERRVELSREQVGLQTDEWERALAAFERGAANQREVDNVRQALIESVRVETAALEELEKIVPRRLSLEALAERQRAQRDLARDSVARSTIAAPPLGGSGAEARGGIIQAIDVEVGESVQSGTRIARIVDLTRIEVVLRLPAAARAAIRPGDPVLLHETGAGERGFAAEVTRIAPEDDAASRTMAVYVELEQDPGAPGIAPGQFLRGEVATSMRELTTPIPRRAVSGDHVMIVEGGAIVLHRVEIDWQFEGERPESGLPDRHWIVPREPLPAGATYVLAPTRRLAVGSRVEAVPSETGEEPR